MRSNPVGWFEIYVQDMTRARAFYEAVFQGKLTQISNKNPAAFGELELWAFPIAPDRVGAPGALVKMPFSPSGGSTLVYFSCEDCGTEAVRAAANGGRIFRQKTSIGEHGFIALVFDTEGNMIGLHSMR